MANKALVLQDGKNVTVAGTTNGQFLVNNGSNEVVFSTATVPTTGQVPVWSGSAWAPGANGNSGTVTSVSSSTTLSGLSLTTTDGTTTPAIALTGTLGVANGGTGATTLTGYVKGAGTATMTASATIPVADVTGAAPLASPTFTGTPSLPTGTTGFTQTAGNNTTALATTAFVTTAVATSSGAPYDVAGEYVGKPPVSTVLMRFIANRSWTLKRTLVQASCTTFPTGSNAVATISVAGANITSGTITWTTGSAVTIGSFADTTITSGQAVVLTVTTADSSNVFENPFFTLGGVVA